MGTRIIYLKTHNNILDTSNMNEGSFHSLYLCVRLRLRCFGMFWCVLYPMDKATIHNIILCPMIFSDYSTNIVHFR